MGFDCTWGLSSPLLPPGAVLFVLREGASSIRKVPALGHNYWHISQPIVIKKKEDEDNEEEEEEKENKGKEKTNI